MQITCHEKIEQPEVALDVLSARRQRNSIALEVKDPQLFVDQVCQDRERCDEGERAANEDGLGQSISAKYQANNCKGGNTIKPFRMKSGNTGNPGLGTMGGVIFRAK